MPLSIHTRDGCSLVLARFIHLKSVCPGYTRDSLQHSNEEEEDFYKAGMCRMTQAPAQVKPCGQDTLLTAIVHVT